MTFISKINLKFQRDKPYPNQNFFKQQPWKENKEKNPNRNILPSEESSH